MYYSKFFYLFSFDNELTLMHKIILVLMVWGGEKNVYP